MTKKAKKIIHEGSMHSRTKARDWTGLHELVLSNLWKEENVAHPAINHGLGVLEGILQEHEKPFDAISQRDAYIAATVVQWLGTNCGRGFLLKYESEMAKLKKQEKEDHGIVHLISNFKGGTTACGFSFSYSMSVYDVIDGEMVFVKKVHSPQTVSCPKCMESKQYKTAVASLTAARLKRDPEKSKN